MDRGLLHITRRSPHPRAGDRPPAGADLISLGRAFLANPDPVERFHRGAPLNPVCAEPRCGGGELGYADYPVLTTAQEERGPVMV